MTTDISVPSTTTEMCNTCLHNQGVGMYDHYWCLKHERRCEEFNYTCGVWAARVADTPHVVSEGMNALDSYRALQAAEGKLKDAETQCEDLAAQLEELRDVLEMVREERDHLQYELDMIQHRCSCTRSTY